MPTDMMLKVMDNLSGKALDNRSLSMSRLLRLLGQVSDYKEKHPDPRDKKILSERCRIAWIASSLSRLFFKLLIKIPRSASEFSLDASFGQVPYARNLQLLWP
jgi:hypothetical protein